VDIIDHPIMGKMRIIKSPVRFGGERLSPARPSPAHGEHTDEVLREFLLSQGRIDQLRKEGIVA